MKSHNWFRVLALVYGTMLGLPFPAPAQSRVSLDSLQKRLDEIDQKARILERKLELAQEGAAAKAKATPALIAGQEGFSLKSADGNFLLKWRGLTHVDGRYFNQDESRLGANTFLIRRLRFVFEGTLSKIFDFKFMPDFAGSRLVLQDSYLDARFRSYLKFKVGKFKTPFGLERLQSPTNLLFVERALPNNLVPNRDTGVQLHGDIAGGVLNYMAGVFNGVLDGGSGDIDLSDGKDYAARLLIAPFVKTQAAALRNLSVGIAGTTGKQEGTLSSPDLPTYVTPGLLTIFRYRSDGTAAGLNWYLNRNVKFALNYEQTSFTGGATSGNRAGEKAFLTRFQVAY